MYVASDKTRYGVAVVLPVLRVVSVRDWFELGRSYEHVRVEDDEARRDQPHHSVVVKHILEFVPLHSERTTIPR